MIADKKRCLACFVADILNGLFISDAEVSSCEQMIEKLLALAGSVSSGAIHAPSPDFWCRELKEDE